MRKSTIRGGALGLAIICSNSGLAQQSSPPQVFSIELTSGHSILDLADEPQGYVDEPQEYSVEIESPTSPQTPIALPANKTISPLVEDSLSRPETELVHTLYPTGTPKISKYVALDEEGNYVNHGEYQEWTEGGELVVNGRFEMGKQTGLWVRICQAKDSKLFEGEPYKKFKAPFQSIAEFANGKLNGIWSITDKDGKKVSEIQLHDGQRQGLATWYHPTGTVLWQTQYENGLTNGDFVEKDATGKVNRQTKFVNGQKTEKKTEYYANKKPKYEYQVLTSSQVIVTPDNWNTTTLATYDGKGEEVKHGPFTTYYESGSVRSQVNYKHGTQDGEFLSWYPNNQREVVGTYSNGRQDGKWNWWHENGMKKATANFDNGELVGTAMAWNDEGKRVNSSEFANTQSTPPQRTEMSSTESISPNKNTPNSGSSRSASASRRPGAK